MKKYISYELRPQNCKKIINFKKIKNFLYMKKNIKIIETIKYKYTKTI